MKLNSIDICELLEHQTSLCAYCFEDISAVFCTDHTIPLAQKGFNTLANMQLVCDGCSRSKGDDTPAQRAERLGFSSVREMLYFGFAYGRAGLLLLEREASRKLHCKHSMKRHIEKVRPNPELRARANASSNRSRAKRMANPKTRAAELAKARGKRAARAAAEGLPFKPRGPYRQRRLSSQRSDGSRPGAKGKRARPRKKR